MHYYSICPVWAWPTLLEGNCARHLALAQFWRVSEYRNFLLNRRERGDRIILDNGAYEGAKVSDPELVAIVRELEPHVVIAPDVLMEKDETVKLARNFLSKYSLPSSTIAYAVVQGKTTEEQAECYHELAQDFLGLCIPRCSPNRPDLVRMLHDRQDWDYGLKHHALGMVSGSLRELGELSALGIDSFDSSAPVWRGLNGLVLPAEPVWTNLPPFHPVEWDGKVYWKHWKVAEANLATVRGVLLDA